MSSPLVGEIRMFGCNFAPKGWSLCQGQLIPIQQNTALFSLLGVQFGGNGTTNFALPDLQGRSPIHQGGGAGLTPRLMGEKSGSEAVTLLAAQMPLHNHSASTTASEPCSDAIGNADVPTGNFPAKNATGEVFAATTNATMGALTVSTSLAPSGLGQPHSNMPPSLVLNFCIAMQGVFPSRS